ncbi:hypothetical protein N9H15_01440 [bacterium]|nr:hypothetical protein [bacterium]
MKYLYGLSIQGIQSYIFATNKLKEIIGASQLIKNLPKQIIEEVLGQELDEDKILIDAAGNFKYEFDNKDQCDLVFKCVPMQFQQLAGNITVSQAIVETEKLSTEDIDRLEDKLKMQRNKPSLSPRLASIAIFKNPKTGNPCIHKDREYLDFNQKKKREEFEKGNIISPFSNYDKLLMDDIEKMAINNESWIGVIHADGNSLGKKVIALGKRITEEGLDVMTTFRDFSNKLQYATENAVMRAFNETIESNKEGGKIPFRPIIIGGDDVTVVTRGDLALDFTDRFLYYFEEETKKQLGYLTEFADGLTACAGIAYIKSHYPFHYGVELAESLSKQAKKDTKEMKKVLAPSCLMFHKMYSSYVREWDKIAGMELKSGDTNLVNGPYYIHKVDNKPTIEELKTFAKFLAEDASPKTNIRKWLSELGKDSIRAKDLMKRTKEITNDNYWKELKLESTLEEKVSSTHLYDALVIEDLNH